MIVWDSFVTYIVKPTINVKVIVAAIFCVAFVIRRTSIMKRMGSAFERIPSRTTILLILFAGFVVRLFWILWSPHAFPAAITEDEIIWRHALDLANGDGLKNLAGEYTAMRPIGYPLFLSLIIRVFGPYVFVAEIVQVLTSVLCIYVVYLIGSKVHSKSFGLLVALMLAFYPTAIYSTKVIMDEHLFIFLWLTGLHFFISDYQKPSWKKVVVGSIVIGLSADVRTYAVLTAAPVFFMWLVSKRDLKNAFLRTLLLTVIVTACAVPWMIRNYMRLGAPIPYTTLLGIHLYWGNNDASGIRYPVNPPPLEGGEWDFVLPKSEIEKDLVGRKAAFRWIAKNPVLFVQKSIAKFFYMMGLNREDWTVYDNFHTIKEGRDPPSAQFQKTLSKIEQYYYVVVFWFSLAGVLFLISNWCRYGDRTGFAFLILMVAIYLATVSIELNFRKYRFPAEVFMLFPAAYAAVRLLFKEAMDRA